MPAAAVGFGAETGAAHDDEEAVEMEEKDEMEVGNELASAVDRRKVEVEAESAKDSKRVFSTRQRTVAP